MIIDINHTAHRKVKKGDFILFDDVGETIVYVIVCEGVEETTYARYKVLCLNSNQIMADFQSKTVIGLINDIKLKFSKEGINLTFIPQDEFKITRA